MRRRSRIERGLRLQEGEVAKGSASKHPDVENSGRGRACRSLVHIACTRSTETIRMQNKEEIWVVAVECD
jgi:hypothetical protein